MRRRCTGFPDPRPSDLCTRANLMERYGGTLDAGPRTDGVTGAVFTVRLSG